MVVPAELFDVSPRMLQVKCATFLSEVSLIFILSLYLKASAIELFLHVLSNGLSEVFQDWQVPGLVDGEFASLYFAVIFPMFS